MVRLSRVWRAVFRMGHPQVRESVPLMTQNGGIPAQLQGDREGRKPATTKFDGMWDFRDRQAFLQNQKGPKSPKRILCGINLKPSVISEYLDRAQTGI